MSDMSDFEEWYKRENKYPDNYEFRKDSEGKYLVYTFQKQYETWQAAKQSMQGEAVGYASEESIKTARNGGDAIFGRMILEVTRTVPLYTHAPDSAARIAELEAENEALRKDAERYRYLRDCGDGFDLSVREEDEEGENWVTGYPPEELDAAIDASLNIKGGAE